MKRLAFTAAALGTAMSLASGGASAADLRARAPVYKAPVPLAYNWTGFYAGGNAGFGLGAGESTLAVPVVPSGETVTLGAGGGIAGLQAGYNWQFGDWVIGAETDIQWSGIRGSNTCVLGCFGGTATTFGTALDWFGTVRARVGHANGSVLAYYTAGFAYGDTRTTLTQGIAAPATAIAFDETRTGWTFGSGVEAALAGNWTGKIEYLYVDLGSNSTAFTLGGNANTLSADYKYHVFRAGLNYRFGGAPMLSAAPAADWRGFYAGGNAGSGIARNASALNLAAVSAERFDLMPEGFLGGAQVGYNWQNANVVYGVEADIQGSTFKTDSTCLVFCTPATPLVANIKQTLPWFGTLRGRLGYASGPALFYITGGLAYGDVKTTITEALPGGAGVVTISNPRAGYALGGGIERPTTFFGLLGPGWTAKSEYLYVDLGNRDASFTVGGVAQTFHTDTQFHIFRGGLNYHFNQPVMARY